jgi:hypothetical protein
VKPLAKGRDYADISPVAGLILGSREQVVASRCRAEGMIGALARHPNTIALKFPAQRSGKWQKNGFEKARQENGRETIREEIRKKKSLGKCRQRKRPQNG